MIEVKDIEDKDYNDAMKIKVSCWTDELAGKAENTLIIDNEINEWKKWMNEAKLYSDKRITIYAHESEKMIGVAAASFADETDAKHGIELNGLWVDKKYRGQRVSIALLKSIIQYFDEYEIKKVVVYNCHFSESNAYFRKLGFQIIRQEKQQVNNIQLLVDVFICDFDVFKNRLYSL